MAQPERPVEPIETVEALIEQTTDPSPEVTEAVSRLDGPVMILGIAGKMGPTLGKLLVRAGAEGVVGVSRFSNPSGRERLEEDGIQTVKCDLLDDESLRRLPEANHIYLVAGHKFGSTGNESTTWAMNTMLPAKVMQRFPRSQIVYVSSGNVYRYVDVDSGGAAESDPVDPVGEYAQSRLGGERLVEYCSSTNGTPVAIIRLFYATELRYGIILDIAQKVWAREPIPLEMGHVNQIWQGDANAYLARCFPFCAAPPATINLTGPETLSVRELAAQLGERLGIQPSFEGSESSTALLGNAQEMIRTLGSPRVAPQQIVDWVAWWVKHSGDTLNKPTKYESRTGQF